MTSRHRRRAQHPPHGAGFATTRSPCDRARVRRPRSAHERALGSERSGDGDRGTRTRRRPEPGTGGPWSARESTGGPHRHTTQRRRPGLVVEHARGDDRRLPQPRVQWTACSRPLDHGCDWRACPRHRPRRPACTWT